MLAHFADAVFAHRAADTTDGALIAALTVPNATDSTTASTLLAAMKSALERARHQRRLPRQRAAVDAGRHRHRDARRRQLEPHHLQRDAGDHKRHVFSAVERIDWEPV